MNELQNASCEVRLYRASVLELRTSSFRALKYATLTLTGEGSISGLTANPQLHCGPGHFTLPDGRVSLVPGSLRFPGPFQSSKCEFAELCTN